MCLQIIPVYVSWAAVDNWHQSIRHHFESVLDSRLGIWVTSNLETVQLGKTKEVHITRWLWEGFDCEVIQGAIHKVTLCNATCTSAIGRHPRSGARTLGPTLAIVSALEHWPWAALAPAELGLAFLAQLRIVLPGPLVMAGLIRRALGQSQNCSQLTACMMSPCPPVQPPHSQALTSHTSPHLESFHLGAIWAQGRAVWPKSPWFFTRCCALPQPVPTCLPPPYTSGRE